MGEEPSRETWMMKLSSPSTMAERRELSGRKKKTEEPSRETWVMKLSSPSTMAARRELSGRKKKMTEPSRETLMMKLSSLSTRVDGARRKRVVLKTKLCSLLPHKVH